MAVKAKEAFIQYSKKMCTRVTIFWMIYRVIVSILLYFRPDVANAMVHMTDGVDTVMIANISIYCGNSIAEKGFYAFGKRKPYNINSSLTQDEEKDDEVDIDKDDDSNG